MYNTDNEWKDFIDEEFYDADAGSVKDKNKDK